MPTIELAFQPDGPTVVRIEAPEGGALVDLCDEAALGDEVGPRIPFSCRSANCGTCRVRVVGDQVVGDTSLLEPPDSDEARGLRELGTPADVRLGCRARVRPLPGTIRLVALGPPASRAS